MTGGRLFGVKAAAIVADAQFDSTGLIMQLDLHLAGFGMFGDIIQAFLADAVEGHLHIGGQVPFPDYGHADRDIRPAGERISQQMQQVAQV